MVAFAELARRLMTLDPEDRLQIQRPEDAVPLLQDMPLLSRQHYGRCFWISRITLSALQLSMRVQ